MGRLQPGATREQAKAQLEAAFHQSVAEHRAARNANSLATGGKALVYAWHWVVLHRNEGDGTFADITERAGLRGFGGRRMVDERGLYRL